MGKSAVGGLTIGKHEKANNTYLQILTIGSSSSGNSTLVYNEDTHILIDCGVSMKSVLEKTARTSFDGLFLSHMHSDHTRGAGPLGRKTEVPIYINDLAFQEKSELFTDCEIINISEGVLTTLGSMQILPFSTKHDATASFGFIVKDKDATLGYLTDTGSISKVIREAMAPCTSLFIEMDYDEELIETYEGYDDLLKDRIKSDYGHLGTQQALDFISEFDISKLRSIIIGHISPRTNSPELVWKHISSRFDEYISKFYIAPTSDPITV